MTETVVVPREATREQQLAMQRALLDNWPKVYDREAVVNGRLLSDVYDAALSAAPAARGASRLDVKLTIHAWVRDHVGVACQMTLTPIMIDALADAILAIQSSGDPGELNQGGV